MEDPNHSDILILIAGQTGAGKSTFINTLAGAVVIPVRNQLRSCTKRVTPISLPCPGDNTRRVILLDTPGFNDTWKDDADTLLLIPEWLQASYGNQAKLTGIIYMHEISQARAGTFTDLNMLKMLFSDNAAKNFVLLTTKWSNVRESEGRLREQQLRKEHWRAMLNQGARMARYKNTPESAWSIVESVVGNEPVRILELDQLRASLPRKRKRPPKQGLWKRLMRGLLGAP